MAEFKIRKDGDPFECSTVIEYKDWAGQHIIMGYIDEESKQGTVVAQAHRPEQSGIPYALVHYLDSALGEDYPDELIGKKGDNLLKFVKYLVARNVSMNTIDGNEMEKVEEELYG